MIINLVFLYYHPSWHICGNNNNDDDGCLQHLCGSSPEANKDTFVADEVDSKVVSVGDKRLRREGATVTATLRGVQEGPI